MNTRYPFLYFAFLIAVAMGLSQTSLDKSLSPAPITPALAAEPAELPLLEGTWQGSWTDTLYNVTGSMTIEIAVDGSDYSATGTIDVSEINAGLGTLNGTGSGSSDGVTLSGTFDCANLGSGTATIGGAFKIGNKVQAVGSGSGSVGAPLLFGPFVFSGTVAEGVIWGTFDFTNPGGGEGRAVLTNEALPTTQTTWGALKAKHRGG